MRAMGRTNEERKEEGRGAKRRNKREKAREGRGKGDSMS